MVRRVLRLRPADAGVLAEGFAAIRAELDVPTDFPPSALAEAAATAQVPFTNGQDRADGTDIPLVTLDPPGSTDLDQALHLQRRPSGGYRVHYAIADVAAFVGPGGALDAEAHRRVETQYAPDARIPLHPPVLSEGAASLLPGQDRPALLWTLDLDVDGVLVATDVRRSWVRSREQLDYPSVQPALDAGTADERLLLLREVGQALQRQERARGGMSLGAPDQEVVRSPQGGWTLEFRGVLDVERWNAQVSLLTGMAAARLMLDGDVGVLRTMPAAAPDAVRRLRRVARGLRLDWPDERSYADQLTRLDAARPREAAFLNEATALFRGATYTAFDGAPPALATHGAVAAPYAHCTAPLRRLVDRYVGEVCVALCAGEPVPEWARAALPALPAEMADGIRRGNSLERANVDLVEAAVLAPYVGATFSGVVVDENPRGGGTVQVSVPAVLARCDGDGLQLGTTIDVRLVEADPARRAVRFAPLER